MRRKTLSPLLILLFGLFFVSVPVMAVETTYYALVRVTSVHADGKYVFVQEGYVMNNSIDNKALTTTKSYKNELLEGNETYIWTLENASGGYYMKNVKESEYLNNSNSSSMSLDANKKSVWTFTFEDGVALIQNKSNENRFLGFMKTNDNTHIYKAYLIDNLDTYPHAITVYELKEVICHAEFSVNGVIVETISKAKGTNISLPKNYQDVEGKVFVGWTETPIDGETDVTPELVNLYKMEASEKTFYAVFGEVESEESITAVFDASNISNLNAANYSNDWFEQTSGVEMWLNTGPAFSTSPFQVYKGTGKYVGVELTGGRLKDVVFTLSDSNNKIGTVSAGELSTDGTTQTIQLDDHTTTIRCYATASNPITFTRLEVHASKWTSVKNYCTTIAHNRPVTITASARYAVYSASLPSDFSGTGVKVYAVSNQGTYAVLYEVTDGIVPANVGVILYKELATNETVTVPTTVSEKETLENNDLIVSDGTVEGDGQVYALAKKTHGVGFYRVKTGVKVPAGKPYLRLNADSREYVGFVDETTGTADVTNKTETDVREVFSLGGMRLNGLSRGSLYLVGGKKMIIH